MTPDEIKHNGQFGPVYSQPLIESLPLGGGPMRQKMPSRIDLDEVMRVNARVVAAYEVLLDCYLQLVRQCHLKAEKEKPMK